MTAPMITRCTHCGTAFRVYANQLEKRAGQVRCGACGEVFDAYATLSAGAQIQVEEPVAAPAAPPVDPAPQSSAEARAATAAPPSTEHPAAAAPPEAATDSPGRTDEVVQTDPPAGVDEAPRQDAERYDFTERAAERAEPRWQRPVAALLAVLFGMQVLFWFRAEIVARVPALAGVFGAACHALGCSIVLPKRAELMTIESSDLQSDGDYLVLVAILRNRASYAQSFPAIELTLTDPRDQPVVRRVLAPRDYLDPSVAADDGVRAGGEVLARVYIDASGVNATGYRIVVFYP